MMQIRSRIAAAFLAILACSGAIVPVNAGTLLPNGEQQFWTADGTQPLAAGCVAFYIPGTLSPRNTYQNSAQTITNTNPVQLDAAGRAIIYGTGTYRQIVSAVGPGGGCAPAGAQIWDQLTESTDSTTTIFAGASAGTPNAITVNAPAFSGIDGQVINYISTNTNTGGATLNPSGFGAVEIVRDSATGPGALTGGELVATNAVSVIYDATAGTFHILSPVTWPNTAGVPVGTVIPVAGFTAPANYAFAYGQEINRVTFSSLFNAITSSQTGSLSSGSPTITGLSDTTQFARGQPVESVGIPNGTTLLSCTASTCTMTANATTTRSGTVTFFAYGDGDGATTFNLPDYRGKSLAGRDNMGGTAANVLQVTAALTTTNGSATATVSSATNLAIGMVVAGNPNVPSGTGISNISGTTITLSALATGTQSGISTRFSSVRDAQGLGAPGGSQVGTLVVANLPPYTPSGGVGVTISGGTFGGSDPAGASIGTGGATPTVKNNVAIAASASFTGTPQGGTSIPASVVPPVSIVNWAVRLTP